jgi:hypothetical protein
MKSKPVRLAIGTFSNSDYATMLAISCIDFPPIVVSSRYLQLKSGKSVHSLKRLVTESQYAHKTLIVLMFRKGQIAYSGYRWPLNLAWRDRCA